MKRVVLGLLGTLLLQTGCVNDAVSELTRRNLESVRAQPARLVDFSHSPKIWEAALADPTLVFDEPTLVRAAYELYWEEDHVFSYWQRVGMVERIACREELTETGLRALAPFLLRDDAKKIPLLLDNPRVPLEILQDYADPPWPRKSGGYRGDGSPALQRFARRRLLHRDQADKVPAFALPELLQRQLAELQAIPEELMADKPMGGWRIRRDFVFEREIALPDVSAVLEVAEPRNASADWRQHAQVTAMILKYPTAAAREESLRRLSPAYVLMGDCPKKGLLICPNYREHVLYHVTREDREDAFWLRLKQADNRW